MTTKLYRKILAGTLLAATMLLSSIGVKAEAMTSGNVNGLSADELVSGYISSDASDAVAATVRSSIIDEIVPTARFSRSPVSDIAMSRAAQDAYDDPVVAQVSNPVEDTFAPLTDDEIRQLLLIDPTAALDRPQPSPGSGFLTPSAYGADWGDAFIGLSGVTAGRDDNKWDGSASVGVGIGDAVENVGVEVSVGIISLDGFAVDGVVGIRLHKVFPQADNLAVALGWSNPIKWGDANDAEDTFYGVVTHRWDLQPEQSNTLPLTASLGVGTGSFRSLGAIADGTNAPNVFGSLGLRVIPELSLVSGWTGSSLGLGVSAAPFDFALVMPAGVSDVPDNTSTGARFNASLGYSFSF